MKVAIYSRVMDENQERDIQSFFDELKNQKLQPLIFHTYFEQIKNSIALPPDSEILYSSENLNSEIQAIISLGGDGTLLDTVTLVRSHNLPVMGINFGRLGFLASIGRDEVKTAIKSLVNHSFVIDRRTLIHLDSNLPMFGNVPYGLNEFAIHKQDIAPMIKIHTYLNGEFLNTYWADGLIVATPTGHYPCSAAQFERKAHCGTG
jgi:NAD+ kinase